MAAPTHGFLVDWQNAVHRCICGWTTNRNASESHEEQAAAHIAEVEGSETPAEAPVEEVAVESNDESLATPAATELADEEGIPLTEVEGSGEEGKVLASDVKDAITEDDKQAAKALADSLIKESK